MFTFVFTVLDILVIAGIFLAITRFIRPGIIILP